MLKRVFSPFSTAPVFSPVFVSATLTISPGLIFPHLQVVPYVARLVSKAAAPPPPQSSRSKLPGEGPATFSLLSLPLGAALIVYQHFSQNSEVGSQSGVFGSPSSSNAAVPPGQCDSKPTGNFCPSSGATAAMGAGQNLTFPGTDIPAVALALRFCVPRIGPAKNEAIETDGVRTLMKRSFSFSE